MAFVAATLILTGCAGLSTPTKAVVASVASPTSASTAAVDVTSPADGVNPGHCPSTDPLAVVRTFLEAVVDRDGATMIACQDPRHPMLGGVDVDHAIRADQRLDHARRTSEQSMSAVTNLVKFLIPFPDEPTRTAAPRCERSVRRAGIEFGRRIRHRRGVRIREYVRLHRGHRARAVRRWFGSPLIVPVLLPCLLVFEQNSGLFRWNGGSGGWFGPRMGRGRRRC